MSPIWICGMQFVIYLDFTRFSIEVIFSKIPTDSLAMMYQDKTFQRTTIVQLHSNGIGKSRLKSKFMVLAGGRYLMLLASTMRQVI